MRIIKELLVFIHHYDWYTTDEFGYVPTDKAPPEAVDAMRIVNSL